MDHIQQQLDKISELNDEQVAELQTSIISEFDSMEQGDPTPETVDQMSSLADMLDTARDELNRREAQKAELSTRAAELSARVKGDESVEEAPVDETTEEAAPEAAAEAPAEEEAIAASAAEEEVAPVSEETPAEEAPEAPAEETEVEAPAEATEFAAEETTETVVETPVEVVAEAPVEETTTEAEFAAEETPVEETTTETEFAAEAPAETVEDAPVEAEASTTTETPTEDEPSAQEEAPVTAAADGTFEAPADRRPVAQADVTPVAITAGADIPGVTAGNQVSDMTAVSELMEKRIHSLRRVNGGDGEQHIVASVTTQYPEARVLGGDREENSRKIEDVTGPAALAASGGFAAPLAPSYEIFGFGTDVRPVKAALPVFQADRGGVRFLTPPVLSSYADAVGVWTQQNDIDAAGNYDEPATSDLRKNLLIVGSATEKTAYTDAITLQLQFGNLLTRAFPELIQRHNELALIQHARIAELNLLSKMNAASTKVTAAKELGVARDFLVQVKTAAAAYRSRHRIDPGTQLRAVIPTWVYDAIAADLTMQMPGDDVLGVTRGTIDSYLALSNVTLTASLDQNTFGAQNAGALLGFPGTFTWFLFSEGSFVFLDGGSLDIGIIRDSGLVGTNDYRMFTETFEGLAFVGIESLAVTSTIAVEGTAAALVDTTTA